LCTRVRTCLSCQVPVCSCIHHWFTTCSSRDLQHSQRWCLRCTNTSIVTRMHPACLCHRPTRHTASAIHTRILLPSSTAKDASAAKKHRSTAHSDQQLSRQTLGMRSTRQDLPLRTYLSSFLWTTATVRGKRWAAGRQWRVTGGSVVMIQRITMSAAAVTCATGRKMS